MCRYFTMLERNNMSQAVFICEHDTLHLMHNHVAIMMSRRSFCHLADIINQHGNHCYTSTEMAVRWIQNPDRSVTLWIGKGAFQLTLSEFRALSILVQQVTELLHTVPLEQLLKSNPNRLHATPENINFSLN